MNRIKINLTRDEAFEICAWIVSFNMTLISKMERGQKFTELDIYRKFQMENLYLKLQRRARKWAEKNIKSGWVQLEITEQSVLVYVSQEIPYQMVLSKVFMDLQAHFHPQAKKINTLTLSHIKETH